MIHPSSKRSERGVTLVEALMAIAILGIGLAFIVPSYVTQMTANSRSEDRSGAMAAAQQIIESRRIEDPSLMPSTGSSAPQLVSSGNQQYQVVTHYCTRSQYCNGTSRQLLIEVLQNGYRIYTAETVFTQLR